MAALPDGFECMNFPMGRENSLAGVETVFLDPSLRRPRPHACRMNRTDLASHRGRLVR